LIGCSSDSSEPQIITPQLQLQKGTEDYLQDYMGEVAYKNFIAHGLVLHTGQHRPVI